MSDFEEKLNMILSSPDTMAQVAALAQQLTGGGEAEMSPPPPSPQPPPGNPFGSIDPALLTRLLPLLRELNSPANDQRTALLQALRPFLKPERQERVDRALQAAHLLQVGKTLLRQWGDPHV